jgi:4-methyl-5(b-hydroxyethyl)-thiazole monophosphate biosynthesis
MKALVALADGVEEMEAVTVIDVLRRGRVEVVAAATAANREVAGSRGVRLVADALWQEVSAGSFDLLVIPGGAAGMEKLRADKRVLAALRDFTAAGKTVAAICAGPLVLEAAGVLRGRRATCYPALRHELRSATAVDEPVVEDGNVITSQGPATAMAFALRLVQRLGGEAAAAQVAAALLAPGPTPGSCSAPR